MISLDALSPSRGERLISPDSVIEFSLISEGSDIDISTLIVKIRGVAAIEYQIFSNGFDGQDSSITHNGTGYDIIIDPEESMSLGKNYDIKIQIKNTDGAYFNFNYSFKIIPDEPILVSSSPGNRGVITTPQFLFFEFQDIIDGIDVSSLEVSINKLAYISNGISIPDVNGSLTDIVFEEDILMVRIDPIEFLKNGSYNLKYRVSDTLGNTLSESLDFIVDVQPQGTLEPTLLSRGFAGFYQGINRVSDVGDGNSLYLEWGTPVRSHYRNDSFVIIYQDSYRLNVFDNPKYLATSEASDFTIAGLETGETLSFGARALEIETGIFNLNGMISLEDGVYLLPEPIEVASMISSASMQIPVSSTEGYPDAGAIFVGREVIRYDSIDRESNIFNVSEKGRGFFGSVPGFYMPGDTVEIYTKCVDTNTVIIMSTPTFHDGYGFDRFLKGEGVVVNDYSDNDAIFHEGFDFCGWHDPMPDQVLNGVNDCGSYQGGQVNGWRGLNIYDTMLDREEVLLGVTGEPVILLKKIWDGITCSCVNSRKVSPKIRSCNICYGTGYVGGFNQFENLRRQDRRVLMSFDEATEDLMYGEKEGLQQEFDVSAWTMAMPSIRDRDMVLRFDYTEDREFIYEVLNVSREKIINRRYGRQRVSLKRLDKTDIAYTYPIDLSRIRPRI